MCMICQTQEIYNNNNIPEIPHIGAFIIKEHNDDIHMEYCMCGGLVVKTDYFILLPTENVILHQDILINKVCMTSGEFVKKVGQNFLEWLLNNKRYTHVEYEYETQRVRVFYRGKKDNQRL